MLNESVQPKGRLPRVQRCLHKPHALQPSYSAIRRLSAWGLTASHLHRMQATRDAMLADAEDHTGQFSPLSPGCPNSSKRLQELFGLFRGDGLERTNTEGPDELLSQVQHSRGSCCKPLVLQASRHFHVHPLFQNVLCHDGCSCGASCRHCSITLIPAVTLAAGGGRGSLRRV